MATATTSTVPIPTGLSNSDLIQVNGFGIFLGAIAPKYHTTPMLSVITSLSNFTLVNPNASVSDIADYLGASVSSVELLLKSQFKGSVAQFNSLAQAITDSVDLIPHPGGGNIALIVVAAIFITITTVVVGLRLYARYAITSSVRVFDWVIVVAWLIAEIWSFAVIWQALGTNAGAQFYDQSFSTYRMSQAFFLVLNATYPIILLLIKTSLLLFYKTLVPKSIQNKNRRFKAALLFTFILALASAVVCFFGTVFQCIPVNYWDNPLGDAEECKINATTVALVTGGLNIFTDILIWMIPMPMVFRLVLPLREKIAVVFVLGLGAFACIASAIRLSAVRKQMYLTNDLAFGYEKAVLTIIEFHLAIICASVPALRALASKTARRPSESMIEPRGNSHLKATKDSGRSGWGSVGSDVATVTIHMDWKSFDKNVQWPNV